MIEQYREQIEELERQIIIENAVFGLETDLESIANGINEESTWIRSAVANVNSTSTNDDVMIMTTDGYVYQLYYNSTYGTSYVEYLGRYDENPFPEVLATYNRDTSSIDIVAKEENLGISKIELIHGGEVVNTTSNSNANIKIDETGWYIVKVTANSGKLRYAWLKVTKVRSIITTNYRSNKWNSK